MWLVAGLGNPGDQYADTRHNIGFMVVDALAARYDIVLKQKTAEFIFGRGFIEGHRVILIKPLTFMNRSGIAVREALRRNGEVDNILIVHDDLDLEPGTIRIRQTGSSGGHNGIKSIIDGLGTPHFPRLKIGIGRSGRLAAEQYVLRPFSKQERQVIEESIERAVDAVAVILEKGIPPAQNLFHRQQ